MKLRLFIIECIVACALPCLACDPFEKDDYFPFTYHFYQELNLPKAQQAQRARNVKAWQRLTSVDIPADAVREAVYTESLKALQTEFSGISSNAFINWIKDNNALYIRDFILLAKEVEELREQKNSPWYYPSHKGEAGSTDPDGRLRALLAVCREHSTGPLADRYALQALRIYRSLCRYREGIDYFNKTFGRVPDDNLMKEMSMGYVAGFYWNLGDTARADYMCARAGEFSRLSVPSAENIARLAYYHPESAVLKASLNGFIGYKGKRNIRILKIADAALRSPHVVHRGDWLYLKAYIEGLYNNNWVKAERLVTRALASKFSSSLMAADARFFKACAGPECGNFSNLTDDMKWMLSEYPSHSQGILFYLVPALMSRNHLSEALLVANCVNKDKPFASTGFQLMLSCEPADVIKYKQELRRGKGIFGVLREHVRNDDDYLNDIIGTLYLRKGRYAEAVKYLRQVSAEYQRSTNLYKRGYLNYNPWEYAYLPESRWEVDWPAESSNDEYFDYEYEAPIRPVVNKARVSRTFPLLDAKLNFATKMAQWQHDMRYAKDCDTRNLARLQYAIGRYNSFNTCWALTQYWCGAAAQCDYLPIYFGGGDVHEIDYVIDTPKEMKDIEGWFLGEITASYAALRGDVAKARANMILRNYRTIARHYPDSPEARYLATHCDRWSDWL